MIYTTKYKKEEKRFKRIKDYSKPDAIENLITFTENEEMLKSKGISKETIYDKQGKAFDAYQFDFPKGFIIIKKYLPIETQLRFAKKALNEFPGWLIREAQ